MLFKLHLTQGKEKVLLKTKSRKDKEKMLLKTYVLLKHCGKFQQYQELQHSGMQQAKHKIILDGNIDKEI